MTDKMREPVETDQQKLLELFRCLGDASVSAKAASQAFRAAARGIAGICMIAKGDQDLPSSEAPE